MNWYSPNRYLCDILDEMRTCIKTLNFSSMLSLIEEVQVIANRMEAGLSDLKDRKSMLEDLSDLKDQIIKLDKQKKKLEKEAEELNDKSN